MTNAHATFKCGKHEVNYKMFALKEVRLSSSDHIRINRNT